VVDFKLVANPPLHEVSISQMKSKENFSAYLLACSWETVELISGDLAHLT
jgi:hypothetical protein